MATRHATHCLFTVLLGTLILGGAVLPAQGDGDPTKTAPLSELLERAIFAEESLGDLDQAIEIYEQILGRGRDERSYIAQAQLRLGSCYLKKGRKEDAVKALRNLVEEFPSQPELVAEARQRLTELGHAPTEAGVTVRRVWSGPEVNLSGSPSPDGRFLTARVRGELAIQDLEDGTRRDLTKNVDPRTVWGTGPSIVSPDGARIAHAWWESDLTELRITGLDGSTRRLLHQSRVTDVKPASWSSDGERILATWRQHDGTWVIALVAVADGSHRVLKELPTGYPLGLSLSPDNRYVAYDLPAGEEALQRDIFLLAMDEGREIPLVVHGASDFHPMWTPDGKALVFLSDRGGSQGVWLLRIGEGQPLGEPMLVRPDTGPIVPMGFTRDGSFYYGVEKLNVDVYTAELEPEGGRATASPEPAIDRFVGRNTAPAWSPDGRSLAFLSHRTSEPTEGMAWTLVVRSIESGREREYPLALELYDTPQKPRWSPDGGSLVVTAEFDTDGNHGFYRIDVESGAVTPLVQVGVGTSIEEPTWSHDGRTLYYDRHFSDEQTACVLVARDLETGEETELVRAAPPWAINYPALSPDGRFLALVMNQDLSGGSFASLIKVVRADGGEPRELFQAPAGDFVSGRAGLVWTADGSGLIYVTGTPGTRPRHVWRIAVDGGEPVRLGIAMDWLRHLSLHPDGRRLAFAAGADEAEVWVMENFLPEVVASR